MKEYPKIPAFDKSLLGKECIAFYKEDGSNLRQEYSAKQKKWYKFGTRKHLFLENDPEYGASVPIFFDKYADQLAKIFHDKYKHSDYMIAYAEFFGPNSFSGQHDPNDSKDLVLFDVSVHRKGFLDAEEFIKTFGHLDIAKVIYQGPLTEEFVRDVREGKYDLNEGVVCKGGIRHAQWSCKIKTLGYLKKLKEFYGEKWQDFWE